MSKVFITQIPHRHDAKTHNFVPAVNVSPASEYGELVEMMPPRAAFFATNDLVKNLNAQLKDYNAEEGDVLLPLGDPIVCSVACAVLAKNGPFSVLRWDRNIGRYTNHKITI